IEQRFGHELEWNEKKKNNPVEASHEFSAQFDGGASFSAGLFSPEQIINNSSITLTTASDLDNKVVSGGISGNFAGIEIDDIRYYLTSDEFLMDYPFLDETLQIKEEDVGYIFNSVDPYSTDDDFEIDFDTIFEWMQGFYSEEDKGYFQDEYLPMIYDKLPEDAFQSDKESITVKGESINAEKLTMHLSEADVKDLLSSLFEKMKNDEYIKKGLEKLYDFGNLGEAVDTTAEYSVEDLIKEYEDGLEEVLENMDELYIPDGLTSTIWVNKNLIVQRDFSLEIGEGEEIFGSITLKGTQLLEDDEQSFDYELTVEDDYDQETVFFVGESTVDEKETTDSLELLIDETTIGYESTEAVNDNKKEFDRTISVEDYGVETKILWSGNATYEEDQMSSEHELRAEDPTLSDVEMFSLLIDKKAELVKSIELPSDDNKKDLGSMDSTELMNYFEYEFPELFEEWMFGNMNAW